MAPTGLLAYIKLLLIAKIVRLQYNLKFTVGALTGQFQSSHITPFQSITVPSTKSRRAIKVNIYRTKAALASNVGPVAVHLNWHGQYMYSSTRLSSSYLVYRLWLHDHLLWREQSLH